MSDRSRNAAIFRETERYYQEDPDLKMTVTRSCLRQRLVRPKDTDVTKGE